MTRTLGAFAVAAIALLVVAGCGSSSSSTTSSGTEAEASAGGAYGSESSGGSSSTTTTSPSEGASMAVVSVAPVPKVGKVIVDSKGFTLYDFHKDKGTTSSCYGSCELAWPPITTSGKPEVGNGASASMLGTTERKDGTMQVTYAGHPLYTFSEDKKPGEANGNDFSAFGAQWYALKPSGEEAGG
jgi:predicted lipoprotein with Yx(FWY)xxD motif